MPQNKVTGHETYPAAAAAQSMEILTFGVVLSVAVQITSTLRPELQVLAIGALGWVSSLKLHIVESHNAEVG